MRGGAARTAGVVVRVSRTWLRAHCRLVLRNEDEDTPYAGHFDHPEAIAWIRDQIARGNRWAWCQVEVRVDFKGLSSTQYLGACSYESEEAFRRCDYFEQLVSDGVEEIAKALETLALEHGLWEHDPVWCVWCAVA